MTDARDQAAATGSPVGDGRSPAPTRLATPCAADRIDAQRAPVEFRPELKITQLNGFVAVYQTRSFTDAADRLGTTQGAVSIRIKELEDGLGMRLFERNNQGVVATPAGDRFYEHGLRLLRTLEVTRRDMRSVSGRPEQVSVGVIPTFSRAALAPAILEFRAMHPDVPLQVFEAFSASLTESTARGELDFAIVPAGPPELRIESIHIGRGPELFVTSTRTTRTHLHPVALGAEPPLRLVLPLRGNARRDRLDAYLKSVRARVSAVIEMDTMTGALELIANTDWVALLPAALLHPDKSGSRLKVHPLADPPLLVDYELITPSARALGSAAGALADALRRQILGLLDDWASRVGAIPGPASRNHLP